MSVRLGAARLPGIAGILLVLFSALPARSSSIPHRFCVFAAGSSEINADCAAEIFAFASVWRQVRDSEGGVRMPVFVFGNTYAGEGGAARLSLARAGAVAARLVALGVDRDMVLSGGLGVCRPMRFPPSHRDNAYVWMGLWQTEQALADWRHAVRQGQRYHCDRIR